MFVILNRKRGLDDDIGNIKDVMLLLFFGPVSSVMAYREVIAVEGERCCTKLPVVGMTLCGGTDTSITQTEILSLS